MSLLFTKGHFLPEHTVVYYFNRASPHLELRHQIHPSLSPVSTTQSEVLVMNGERLIAFSDLQFSCICTVVNPARKHTKW